jgi:LmbE family N-acetylglucosaminyl deacetylase
MSASQLRGLTVLALHAHPDDEAIFTGITLRRLADAGARVVLLLATRGELGGSRVPLDPGETVARRRIAELERSADLLGAARVVLLGCRDSGLPGWPGGRHPRALARADLRGLGRQVAALADQEGASALLYDDNLGIYGHPDHRATHRVGRFAAKLTGATSYMVTVDRDHLVHQAASGHLVHAAAQAAAVQYGRAGRDIAFRVVGDERELSAKYAAITAHASQVAPAMLPPDRFAATYGLEWFRREGAPGALDLLADEPCASGQPQVPAAGRPSPVAAGTP